MPDIIKIGFNKEEPMSFEEAANLVDEKAARSNSDIRKEYEGRDLTINTATEQERSKYLNYCIDLCEKGNKPLFTALLRLKVYLASEPAFQMNSKANIDKWIAFQLTKHLGFNVTAEKVDFYESQALKFIQDELTKIKQTHLPLVGGI